MTYRKSRERRNLDSTLLARYLGSVETNMGTGYIYERVCDFDGSNSLPLDEYIEKNCINRDNRLELERLILDFKELWFKEKIITSNVELANFLVQRRSVQDCSIRIVDNIGSPCVVPLVFYFDYFADKRLKRYWKRFVDLLKDSYPLICDENFINKIR